MNMIRLSQIIAPELVAAAKERLDVCTNVVIVTHMSPDGDAMGSSLAMRHYLEDQGKHVTVVVPNKFPEFLAWLAKADESMIYGAQKAAAD